MHTVLYRALPLAAAALLLAGCQRAPRDVLGTPMTAETATPTPEPTPSIPAGLEDAGLPVLEYDEIRAIRRDSAPYREQMDGYYTMSRDGLWGLMRSDGTEVLACQFSVPLTGCASSETRWHVLQDTSLTWEKAEELTEQLQQTGDGEMCTGEHEGSQHIWYYDPDTQQVQVDEGLLGGSVHDLEETDTTYGTYLPCLVGSYVDGQGDPDYYEAADPAAVVYANADGQLLNDQTYEAGNCFYDQPLTAARQDGKWLYLDQSGTAVTQAVYDATYGDETAAYASPLLNGYAPVCRDGQWGLLDATGTELVPCNYAGAAWDGGLLWLREEDGWHGYTLPGVTKPISTEALLAALPENVTPPDSYPGDGDQIRFTTTWQANVALRAGPGTQYSQLDILPPSTVVECLGRSSEADNWILVQYGTQYGWLCTDYLD